MASSEGSHYQNTERRHESDQSAPTVRAQRCAKLAVLIVSYRNPADVERCLNSLVRSSWTDFEVFVCENAGQEAFLQLRAFLTRPDGPLQQIASRDTMDSPSGRLTIVTKCQFRARAIVVRLAAAAENLGYAGGIN